MSIVVDLAELEQALTRHPTAYLLLPGDERPHVGEVEVSMRGDVLVVAAPGRTARRVVPGRPAVTLLLPPAEPGGYALVVDGEATLVGEELHVEPGHAVLHRRPRAGSPPPPTGCDNDCRPLS
ncbi:hypothetical protein [uncultured Serinicoccus sp.]|uniref:hypothetical protein n=1 Tax=uncultured Serinicoccus sp. TaxID=735514 RepID=UPI00262E56C2|nr:hypothetical protein [uncultured Serinicoccus sp.]